MWDLNTSYQAPLEHRDPGVSKDLDLHNPAIFDECLGKQESYADFLTYFEQEVTEKGVPAVIKEYVLQGDDRADDIFCRMYTDLVHPMIHLGYGIEFQQPSLVAEALAAACVHENWPKDFLLPTEEYVRSNPGAPSGPLLDMLHSLGQDPEITSAVKDSDPFNKIRDGFLKRATSEQLVPYLSQFRVKPTPEDLQRKLAEMMHTGAYTMGAAQRQGKCERIDFVLLHNVTLSVFYPAILAQDWLSDCDKARLLEAKARVDAVMYGSCKSPALYPERVIGYSPRHPEDSWPEFFHRANIYREEGHVVKVIRALYSLEQLNEPAPGFPIGKGDFPKIAHMVLDSVERAIEPDGHKMPGTVAEAMAKQVGQGGEFVVDNQKRWVFYGGLSKAWQFVPDLEEVKTNS